MLPEAMPSELKRQIRDFAYTLQLYTTGEVTLLAVPGITPGDFDGNGYVDAADYVLWRKLSGSSSGFTAYRSNFSSTRPEAMSDFNYDGNVDVADYIVWRKGLGITYAQADYDVWLTHFGEAASADSISMSRVEAPELSTIVLVASWLFSLYGFVAMSRRQRTDVGGLLRRILLKYQTHSPLAAPRTKFRHHANCCQGILEQEATERTEDDFFRCRCFLLCECQSSEYRRVTKLLATCLAVRRRSSGPLARDGPATLGNLRTTTAVDIFVSYECLD